MTQPGVAISAVDVDNRRMMSDKRSRQTVKPHDCKAQRTAEEMNGKTKITSDGRGISFRAHGICPLISGGRQLKLRLIFFHIFFKCGGPKLTPQRRA